MTPTQFISSIFTPWVFIVVTELFLGCTATMIPSYAIPLFVIALILLAIFFYPELSYILLVLSLATHVLLILIPWPHSVPCLVRHEVLPDDLLIFTTLPNLTAIIAISCWLFARMANTRPPCPGTSLDLAMWLFFVWAFCSMLWTPDLSTGFLKIFLLSCCYFGYYLSIAIIRSTRILNTVIWLLILIGVTNAAIAVYSLHGEPIYKEIYHVEDITLYVVFTWMAKERGMGLSHPSFTAYFLNISIFLSIGMFLVTTDLKKRFILALIGLFMVYGHLTTLSKGGLLGLLAGLLFLILTHGPLRKHLFTSLSVIAITLVILFPLVYLSWPDTGELLRGRASLSPRWHIWEAGFEDLVKSYGFGYGCGMFYFAHNILFSVLFELGIPGLLIFLWILMKVFLTIRSSRKKMLSPYYEKMILALSAGMVSIMASGMFDFFYWDGIMWTFLGISMAVINLANEGAVGQIPNNGNVTWPTGQRMLGDCAYDSI